MNEALFFLHTFLIMVSLLISLYLGKEALVSFISLSWFLANVFVSKEILLFGLEVTASDIYSIGALLALPILQDRFGRSVAQKALLASFFLLLFSASTSILHLLYTPSLHDSSQPHFIALFQPIPSLVLASLGTFLFSNELEILLFGYLRRRKLLSFAASSLLTSLLVIVVDTALFTWWGLSNRVHSVWDVFYMSLLVKGAILLLLSPMLALLNRLIPYSPYPTKAL